jgi:energy-coupling factor transport system ATP-binding protein
MTPAIRMITPKLVISGGLWMMPRRIAHAFNSGISRSANLEFQQLSIPNHQLFADSVRSEVLQPGVSPQRADTLPEQLSLQAFSEQNITQSLSQGQKRCLALGAVLARQPQICLLDEITVGQNPHSLKMLLQVLRQFIRQGGALILTSHDPIAAAALQAREIDLSFAIQK